jgi:hypothetical protein
MRGRSRGKGPNPLTRSYESNGPDVKIRGTAQHVADKYAQLARDATASGDPVAAENYLQHAEHYYRLIAAAQETYRQQFGTQGRPFDDEGDEGDDEMSPNGFPYQGGMQGGADEFGEMGGNPYEMRQGGGGNERQDRNGGRFDRGERQDRGYDRNNDRQGGGGERQDRNGQRFDRGGERFDRNANGGGGNYDRNGNRPQQGERFDRNGGGAANQPQNGERFDRPERQDRPEGGGERRERFGRGENREGGREGGRREFNRDRGQNRPEGGRVPGPAADERDAPAPGLPAFLTTPVRSTIALEPDDVREPVEAVAAYAGEPEGEPALAGTPEPRPRRTRRPRRAEPTEALDFGGEADKPAE